MPESDCIEPLKQSPKVGRYANVFRVGFNAFEVVIEFGEQFSDGEHARMHTRVVTNPVFARGLVNSLNDALTNYASAYSSEPAPLAQGSGRGE
jgi:CTP:molybdopterin cytidylyltransferase MocA